MPKTSDFFYRFKEVCEEKGRSATSVVKGCGLSSCLVTAWKGGSSPTIATVTLLAKELGVSVATLVTEYGGEDKAPPPPC